MHQHDVYNHYCLIHASFRFLFGKVSIYINLRRSRDGTQFCCSVVLLFGCSGVYLTVRFEQLLRYGHKRIVNIMKEYFERNNMYVELIRFRKKNVDFIHVCEGQYFASLKTQYACIMFKCTDVE